MFLQNKSLDNRTTVQPYNCTAFELLLQRSNTIMRKILPVIVILALSFILTERAFSQSPNPALCNDGDNTSWGDMLTINMFDLPANVLGCDDPDCTVTVEYYRRHTSWGWEFTVATITFSGQCDYECMANPWKVALWMLAVTYQTQFELLYPDDCYDSFIYRLATCWHKTTTFVIKFTACDEGACCSGTFEICLRGELPYDTYLEFTRISELQMIYSECTLPCEFYQCSELMPNPFEVTTHRPDNTPYTTFKQSVQNLGSSNTMELRPNPAINSVNIHITVQETGIYQLNVVNNIGNTIHSQSIRIGSGLVFDLELTTQDYVSGNYNVVLTNNEGLIFNQQFIKIK